MDSRSSNARSGAGTPRGTPIALGHSASRKLRRARAELRPTAPSRFRNRFRPDREPQFWPSARVEHCGCSSVPCYRGGETYISFKYSGRFTVEAPAPNPTRIRPRTIGKREDALARRKEPMPKSHAAYTAPARRPRAAIGLPALIAPARPPAVKAATTTPYCASEMGRQFVWRAVGGAGQMSADWVPLKLGRSGRSPRARHAPSDVVAVLHLGETGQRVSVASSVVPSPARPTARARGTRDERSPPSHPLASEATRSGAHLLPVSTSRRHPAPPARLETVPPLRVAGRGLAMAGSIVDTVPLAQSISSTLAIARPLSGLI